MDLRDYFAGLAMQAVINECVDNQRVAHEAYLLADAMMAERAPQNGPSEPIETLELRIATNNALKGAGVHTVDQIIQKVEIGLIRIPGIGRVSLRDIQEMLERRGYGSLPRLSRETRKAEGES